MGLKVAIVQKRKHGDEPEITVPNRESTSVVSTGVGKTLDKQKSHRRKGIEKSVLDDIMGDPEDFRGLVESDAESDGGRWEDVARSCEEVVVDESSRLLNGKAEEHDSNENNSVKVGDKEGLMAIATMNDEVARVTSSKEQGQNFFGAEHGEEEGINDGPTEGSHFDGHFGMRIKYFIIKSLNHDNLTTSIQKGIWATQAMNEQILNKAFETADKVLLIFSVNMSGHFQGYAQMSSPIGRKKVNIWSESNMGANPWGGTFEVQWLRLYDLPFQRTVHLKNPLNSFKPVKISRDCQELTPEIGEALCSLIDEGAEKEIKSKRKLALNNALLVKKQRLDMAALPLCFASPTFNESYDLRMVSTISVHQLHGSTSVSQDKPRSSKLLIPPENDSERRRDLPKERGRKLSREKDHSYIGNRSQSVNLPPEEDLLNMTYEEYVEHHGKSRAHQQGMVGFSSSSSSSSQATTFHGRSWFGTMPSAMGYSDTTYSDYLSSFYSSQQGGSIAPSDYYFPMHGVSNAYHGIHPP